MNPEKLSEALYEKYIAPTKKQRTHAIGIEIEMPVVNLSGKAVDESLIMYSGFIFREAVRAVDSSVLSGLLDTIPPQQTLLGHIRFATVGSVRHENCHPFTARKALTLPKHSKLR